MRGMGGSASFGKLFLVLFYLIPVVCLMVGCNSKPDSPVSGGVSAVVSTPTPLPGNPATTPSIAPDNSANASEELIGPSSATARPIQAQITASRTEGVAPLAVFFDATSTTGLGDDDYVDADFSWSFGDADADTWATTGGSRNTATGFLAAHVYEQPGQYTVTLAVKDKTGNTGQTTLTITVSDFTGTTYYVSSLAGNDANDGLAPDPAGSGQGPWKTLAKVMASAGSDTDARFICGGNLRILFRRGETFPANGNGAIGLLHVNPAGYPPKGPLIIGAYGSGPRPVILEGDPNRAAIEIQSDCHDVRIMDLEIAGPYVWGGEEPGEDSYGVFSGDNVSDILLWRLDIHHLRYGVLWSQDPTRNQFVVDCAIHHNALIDYGTSGGSNLVLLGSTLTDTYISHNAYSYFEEKYYIAHNLLARPGWNARSNTKPGDGKYYANRVNLRLAIDKAGAKDVVITDNRCTDGETKIQVGLMDSSSVGVHYEHVLVERNYVANRTNAFWATYGIFLDAVRHAVVRNNVLVRGPEGSNDIAIALDPYAVQNAGCVGTANVAIYNNSCYSHYTAEKESDSQFLSVRRSDSDNLTVRNNVVTILAAPAGHFQNVMVELPEGYPLSRIASNYNLWHLPGSSVFATAGTRNLAFADWQAQGKDGRSQVTDPLFVNPEAGDLHVQTLDAGYAQDSPAVNRGAWVPVFDDHDRNPRPQGERWDIGAYESTEGGPASARPLP